MTTQSAAPAAPASSSPVMFYREEDGTLPVRSAVFQALGAASTCWENMSGTGVFDDRRACEVGDALLVVLAEAGLDVTA